MDSTSLLNILLSHREAKDCALSLLNAAQECSMESLENTFTVALGTGGMSQEESERLLAALERLARIESLENHILADRPELSRLREEIDELTARQNKLWEEQRQVAALRERVNSLQLDLEGLRAQKGELIAATKEISE